MDYALQLLQDVYDRNKSDQGAGNDVDTHIALIEGAIQTIAETMHRDWYDDVQALLADCGVDGYDYSGLADRGFKF
jgi:hypothetical protein